MDDGLQNPTLAKTLSLLVIDGGAGFGNGQVIPAGPLREPVSRAAARCHAAVLIGADRTGAAGLLPPFLPVLRARLVPHEADLAALPPRLLAFAGIGRPEKFFDTLRIAGHDPLETIGFADHHAYRAADIDRLRTQAARRQATLVTTTKDAVRLPRALHTEILTLRIRLEWEDETEIEALLERVLAAA
jgi:tetraacyldisaccharide 4'-kinase